MDQDRIDQAIRSRSMMIDLSMTLDQKIDRMEFIAASDEFLPEYDATIKADALALIRKIKSECKEILSVLLLLYLRFVPAIKTGKTLLHTC
jgi:hypothetical protein